MPDILKKIGLALKPGGHFYISVKEGDFEGNRGGRYFVDYSKRKLMEMIEDTGIFKIKDVWKSEDAKEHISDTKWLNLIAKKKID